MSLTFGFMMLAAIFILWKLFVDGWLFKIILFIAGWFGLYMACHLYMTGADNIAITLGQSSDPTTFTWASVVPTVICFLCLLCTKS